MMKDKEVKYVIIAGCGKLGASIASSLSIEGKNVVVIDRESENFRDLSTDYSGYKIIGEPTDLDTLIQAGIEKSDMVVSTMTDDNSNIMVSEIAKKIFKVKKVVSRLYEVDKNILLNELDIEIIYPSKLSIDEFYRYINIEK